MHINEALNRLGQGAAIEEFDKLLRNACLESVLRDGKSEVNLKLSIAPNGDGVSIETTVSSKTPRLRHAKTFLFLDGDGELTAQDPKQGILTEISRG